jgi:hypothetical protein
MSRQATSKFLTLFLKLQKIIYTHCCFEPLSFGLRQPSEVQGGILSISSQHVFRIESPTSVKSYVEVQEKNVREINDSGDFILDEGDILEADI